MRNFQDILHRHGSLSMVWMVGNGVGPARNLSRSSKTRNIILNSNLVELCDRLLEVAVIPERLADDEDGYENFMDIKKLAILLYGLYEFYKHQLKAFKRRLDQHYQKIKWRITPHLGLGPATNIDLPARKEGRCKELVLAAPTKNLVQSSFGEFNLDEDPVLAGTPRKANLGEPLPVRSIGDDSEPIDIAGVEIIAAINAFTASRRKRRRTGERMQDPNGAIKENDLLQWLGQNPNTANKRDITIREDDLITSPRIIALQQDEFPFEDVDNGVSLGFNVGIESIGPVDFNDVQQQPAAVDVMEPADTGSQNVVLDLNQDLQEPQVTTPLRPATPVKPVRLAQRIQADELSVFELESVPIELRSQKRRRTGNQGITVDNTTQLSKLDLKSRIKRNQNEIDELGSVDVPRVIKKNDMHLINLGTGKKAVEVLQNHFGRGMGKALSAFVNNIQNIHLNLDSREVERRRSERSGHPQTSTSRNVIPEEESVNYLERPDPEVPKGESVQGVITSGIEEVSLPGGTGTADQGATNLPPHQDLQDGLVVAEEIASPYHPNNEYENRMDEDNYIPVPQIYVGEVDAAGAISPAGSRVTDANNYLEDDSKTFHERCPPGTTRKGTAALEFHRLLKLQKMKKVKLEQEVFYGPIKIKPLPQNMTHEN